MASGAPTPPEERAEYPYFENNVRHRPIHQDLSSPADSQLDGGEFFSEAEYLSRRDTLPSEYSQHYAHHEKLTNGITSSDEEVEFSSTVEVDMLHLNGSVATRRGGSRMHTEEGHEGKRRREGKAKAQRAEKKRPFIRFVPLRIPLHRRLETLAVLWHGLALGLCLTIFWFLCANPLFWPFLVPYLLHLLLSRSHTNGATPYIRSPYLRSLPLWTKYFVAFFPISLHRSVPLDPTKNYIFGCSPHGIISIGAWGAFIVDDLVQGPSLPPNRVDEYGKLGAGEREQRAGYLKAPGGGFGRLFPGIRNTVLTLEGNFRVPLYREYLLAMGIGSVSRRSCEAHLRGRYPKDYQTLPKAKPEIGPKRGPIAWVIWCIRLLLSLIPAFLPAQLHPYLSRPTHPSCPPPLTQASNSSNPAGGNAITIVIGGATESLFAVPNTYRIILRRRRGFLKLALRDRTCSTAVVPVLAFGENDLYSTLIPRKGTLLWKAQRLVKRFAGWTIPVFWARGVLNYDVGIVPFRKDVNVVVGRPVFPKPPYGGGARPGAEPSEEEVDDLQEEYMEELMRLWDEWKDVFARDRRGELEIVE